MLDGLVGKLGIPSFFGRLGSIDRFPICSYLVAHAYAERIVASFQTFP